MIYLLRQINKRAHYLLRNHDQGLPHVSDPIGEGLAIWWWSFARICSNTVPLGLDNNFKMNPTIVSRVQIGFVVERSTCDIHG